MLYELYVQIGEVFEFEGVFEDTDNIVGYTGMSKRIANFIISADYENVPKAYQKYAIIEVRSGIEYTADIAEWNKEVDEQVLN